MPRSRNLDAGVKTCYRPIEAAIRWCGLMRFEASILTSLGQRSLPNLMEFPRWPSLRLYTERIFDALEHGELRCDSKVPVHEEGDSIVRHVDLKIWMAHYYPGERPPFLFDEIERALHPAVSLRAVHVLLAELEATKVQFSDLSREYRSLQLKCETLSKCSSDERPSTSASLRDPGPRAETTYLNIIGALLSLLLGKAPSGAPYSSFSTQEAVISALLAYHPATSGITLRTLQAKFALARRSLGKNFQDFR
ncbi:hypothetical protein [Variovorax paradoxus]|jgi:hypothetical protein|uniref:Receptor protein-tyrosine kinase n=1 Tax=Variovorax paradoxus TaxID=34073 RepID=A0A0H2MCR6_VARPD|nr:hypothetical protein [Variovorax paradoxus]KLN58422.1 hypothetical protein VPARA_05370 [Variovorax paradoxus]